MSDTTRQSLSSKAGAALKPDSEKSTMEHIGDKLMGNADNMAAKSTPQSEKSTTQAASDALSGNNEDSLYSKAKNAMGMGDK